MLMDKIIVFAISSDLPQMGKSELAKILADRINSMPARSAKIMALADVLKDEACKNLSLDRKRIDTDIEYKTLHRPKLIAYGAMMRHDNVDYWCERLFEDIKTEFLLQNIGHEGQKQALTIIVPDLRFKNELAYLSERIATYHIHITVNNYTMILRAGADFNKFADDESEIDFQLKRGVKPDFIIDNSFTKEVLKVNACAILQNTWIM